MTVNQDFEVTWNEAWAIEKKLQNPHSGYGPPCWVFIPWSL